MTAKNHLAAVITTLAIAASPALADGTAIGGLVPESMALFSHGLMMVGEHPAVEVAN